jgi:hypothetical protein
LAYRSTENGPAQVYVRPFPNVNGGKWQVSTEGGGDPVWSHSGKELFYINRANEMVAATIVEQPSFSAQAQTTLFKLPLAVRSNPSRPLFDVSRDDRRFIMIRSGGQDTTGGSASHERLILVTNWSEELRAKVPRK